MRRAIGPGAHGRGFVSIRPSLDVIARSSFIQPRQHQWSTQLVEDQPPVVYSEEEEVGGKPFVSLLDQLVVPNIFILQNYHR